MKRCPKCHGELVKILYGLPVPSPELDRQLENGEIELGGCCVTGNDPPLRCKECWTGYSSDLKKEYGDDYENRSIDSSDTLIYEYVKTCQVLRFCLYCEVYKSGKICYGNLQQRGIPYIIKKVPQEEIVKIIKNINDNEELFSIKNSGNLFIKRYYDAPCETITISDGQRKNELFIDSNIRPNELLHEENETIVKIMGLYWAIERILLLNKIDKDDY